MLLSLITYPVLYYTKYYTKYVYVSWPTYHNLGTFWLASGVVRASKALDGYAVHYSVLFLTSHTYIVPRYLIPPPSDGISPALSDSPASPPLPPNPTPLPGLDNRILPISYLYLSILAIVDTIQYNTVVVPWSLNLGTFFSFHPSSPYFFFLFHLPLFKGHCHSRHHRLHVDVTTELHSKINTAQKFLEIRHRPTDRPSSA